MFFNMIYGKLGVFMVIVVVVITVLAVIRSMIKIRKNKEWEIKEEKSNPPADK